MGSVKDLVIDIQPTAYQMGLGRFKFSDRFSVFDWGEMPDHIAHKGASLNAMSAYFFDVVQDELDFYTHYRGIPGDSGSLHTMSNIAEPSIEMSIYLTRALKPTVNHIDGKLKYDYNIFKQENGNFVIPLEVIYRNGLPQNSSVFKRLKEGSLSLQDLGLTEPPTPGMRLPKPFIDASTKFERFDRYPGWPELQGLAGLNDTELGKLKAYAGMVNRIITREMKKAGFSNEDGKFEFAFSPERELLLVDTLGTLDECRFLYNGPVKELQGLDVSKEIPRRYYREHQPEWIAEIDAAKKQDRENWKTLVKTRPEPLPHALKEILENLYPAVANKVIGRVLFSGMPSVENVLQEYVRFKGKT